MAYKVGDRVVFDINEDKTYDEFRDIQQRNRYITVRMVISCNPESIPNIADRSRCNTCSRIKYEFNEYDITGYCDDLIQQHSRLYMTPAKPKPFTIK